jgi:anthranilate synthase/aminodeoxychorismate synthase-like glutamine amidotransferase
MRVVLIDNRDSFTYNLEQQIRSLGASCTVVPSLRTTIKDIRRLHPQRIVISPGPGRPECSGVSLKILSAFIGRVPILGVCLGHQCIGTVFGGGKRAVVHAPEVTHGKTSPIYHDGTGLMCGFPSPFMGARYHSLILRAVPEGFERMCWTGSQNKAALIMGIRHRNSPLFGVQFHPESFLTEGGDRLMKNFLNGEW